MTLRRITVIVLDSVGVGELPDASAFGDTGCNTLGHIAQSVEDFSLPNLARWGLGNILPLSQIPPAAKPEALWGKMAEQSAGKDTTVGHWELAGVPTKKPLSVWPKGFPSPLLEKLRFLSGRGILGNKPASGTAIIEELGQRHLETGALIVYTSADSVLQIAAHERVLSAKPLHDLCRALRPIADEHRIGRIIARPFKGRPGSFQRTYDRRDFSMPPPKETVLEAASKRDVDVVGVGKIEDIFAGRGLTRSIHTEGNRHGLEICQELLSEKITHPQLLFVNLVDFDMLYGHRNDPQGYAEALKSFDEALPFLERLLTPEDLFLITADHGNDPTAPGTDHTREYVPILMKAPAAWAPQSSALGIRECFCDVAATLTHALDLPPWPLGVSLLADKQE